eukprot:13317893-Alexandrium_andersonii.AAC.1
MSGGPRGRDALGRKQSGAGRVHCVTRREALESVPGSTLSARQDIAQGMCSDVATSSGMVSELPRSVQ